MKCGRHCREGEEVRLRWYGQRRDEGELIRPKKKYVGFRFLLIKT
jgi:hypothetical protein